MDNIKEDPVNDIVNVELCSKIESEFLHVYEKMSENLSLLGRGLGNLVYSKILLHNPRPGKLNKYLHYQTHFESILEILRNENITVTKDTIDTFRTYLFDSLTANFKKMWRTQQLPESISILELLKEKYRNCRTQQWRPNDKSVYEQTIEKRLLILRAKKRFMDKQLNFQKTQIEILLPKIEQSRERIAKLIKEREVVSYQIDHDAERLKTIQDDIFNKQRQSIDLMFPSN